MASSIRILLGISRSLGRDRGRELDRNPARHEHVFKVSSRERDCRVKVQIIKSDFFLLTHKFFYKQARNYINLGLHFN